MVDFQFLNILPAPGDLHYNTYKNPTGPTSVTFFFIFGIVFSLVFMGTSYFIVLQIMVDMGLFMAFVGFFFFQSAFWFLVFSIRNYRQFTRNPWKELTFEQGYIKIKSTKEYIQELSPGNIQAIFIERKSHKPKYSRRYFVINLSIETVKGEIVPFGTIYRTYELDHREEHYMYLESLIRSYYDITPTTKDFDFGAWFRKNGWLLLVSSILYIIPTVLILVLGNY